MMRLSDLLGLPAIDVRMARRDGFVLDVLVDLTGARLVALDIETRRGVERLPVERVRRIGRQGIMVGDPWAVDAPADLRVAEHCLAGGALIGIEMLMDNGDRLGYLTDVHLDQDTVFVRGYELAPSSWERYAGRRVIVVPEQIIAASPDLVIVRSRPHAARYTSAGPAGGPAELDPAPSTPLVRRRPDLGWQGLTDEPDARILRRRSGLL